MRRVSLLGALVAAAGFGAVAALGAVQHSGPAAQLFSSTCSVGLAGTALSITAEGPDAAGWCASVEGTAAANGGTWYRYGENDTLPGVLMCRQTFNGNTVTVRDQGALTLYGSDACGSISTWGPQSFGLAVDTDTWDGGSGIEQDAWSDVDPEAEREYNLQTQGVCLLTVPDHDVAIYLMGSGSRDRCEDMIASQAGGLDGWRIAQGFNGTGEQPATECRRDYGDQVIEVYDSGLAYFGGRICEELP